MEKQIQTIAEYLRVTVLEVAELKEIVYKQQKEIDELKEKLSGR
jgi:hypothetical protein